MSDLYLDSFKQQINSLWAQSQDQFDFAVACYLQGRADKERMADPDYNAAFHITQNWGNNDHNTA